MEILLTERENGTVRHQIRLDGPSRVEQSHRKRCDINTIVNKYKKTGLLPRTNGVCHYGDFTCAEDFHTAQNSILAAKEEFLSLPADIRKRFHNDPAELLEFVNDPENVSEAAELGLIDLPGIEEPAEPIESPAEPVEPTNPPE